MTTPKKSDQVIDALWLAQRCREISLQRFARTTSCVETSLLFERVAFHLGGSAKRVVCQVAAYSPKLAEQVLAGNVDGSLIGQPGYWSVGVGIPQFPEDFVGRSDEKNNRFVGHVVCLVDDNLIDPTADQMSRPQWDMPVPSAVICKVRSNDKPHPIAVTRTEQGVLLKYVLHPEVKAPAAKSNKIVERLAISLAKSIQEKA